MGTAWQVGFGNSTSRPFFSSSTKFDAHLLIHRSFAVGGIIAAYAFLAKDAPIYKTGYSICLAFICLSAVSCLAYFFYVNGENRRREKMGEGEKMLTWEEKQDMGDLNPDYRYQL